MAYFLIMIPHQQHLNIIDLFISEKRNERFTLSFMGFLNIKVDGPSWLSVELGCIGRRKMFCPLSKIKTLYIQAFSMSLVKSRSIFNKGCCRICSVVCLRELMTCRVANFIKMKFYTGLHDRSIMIQYKLHYCFNLKATL